MPATAWDIKELFFFSIFWDKSCFESVVSLTGFGSGFMHFIEKIASPQMNLLTAFVFGILGTAYFAFFGKDLKK